MSTNQLIANRFEISDPEKDLLGRGGMGDVYRATDAQTGEPVAVKALKPDIVARDPDILERFVREGQALRQLNHPNIVGMVAAVEEEGQHYLVMEYVGGGSLRDLLAAQGPLPSARVVEIALEVADALTRAHHLGIIHRDLKPANVLLAKDGTPRLTDFGIAHVVDSPRLTQTGVLVGTVDYLSPEACQGETLDERTDIWAFGVLLYEMLTGERPFVGETLTAKLTVILTQPIPDLASLCPDAPDALVDLVYRMLEKDRQQRVPSVRLVGAELEAILKGREVPTPARLTPAESRFAPPTPLTQPPSFLEEGEPVERPVFVARERELAQLDGYLNTALAGQGQVVFVTGEAGQGKTALVQEFAWRAQAAHPELVVAGGNCNAHTGIGDPYLPFREILGLLTGDVEERWAARAISQEQARRLWHTLPLAARALVEAGPDLVDLFVPGAVLVKRAVAFAPGGADWRPQLEELVQRKAAVPGDPNPQQSALFEQYSRVVGALAGQRPLLLVLDDLQWADGGSTSLLFHLGRRIEGSRVLIVGTYRPAEVALGRGGERHPLESVVNEFKRHFGDIEVDLGQAEDRQFVEAFLDTEPNRLGDAFRRILYQQTEGHPLSTVELLRDMQERGDLVQDQEGRWVEGPALDWERLPTRVEAVIAERIGRLAEPAREALRVASVEGETFTAEVVARVLGANEREMVRQLGKLDREHRLVSAQGIRRRNGQSLSLYRFRHILFQRYLYNNLGEAEQAYLHEDVGTALEALYGERVEEIAVQLARHFQEAGIAGKAVDYLGQAGDQARALYAHQEAVDHYQQALVLLKEQGEHERAARTLMKLGLTYHAAFDFRRAHQAYEEGLILWQRIGEVGPSVSLPSAPHALRVFWVEPPTLDPTTSHDSYSHGVISQLFSSLVKFSPEMDVVPDMAQSWAISEGGRKYVFHLRDDACWSDGTPVTAEDFAYAWRRVLDPATESTMAGLLYDIKGARAFHRGQVSDADSVGVRALDEHTLAVELEGPTSYFLHLLAVSQTFPVPRHVVQAHGVAWTEVDNIVTNGPFRLESWRRGQSMVLVRNPEYHGRFTGNVQQIDLITLEWSAALKMYEDDSLDVLDLRILPPLEMDRARQRHAGEHRSAPLLATIVVAFDVSRPPFDDARVRQAFALATDRETLGDVIWRGYVFPATGGFVPPGMPGHSPGIGLPYDPQKARRLMAEAGYPGGRGFPVAEALMSSQENESLSRHLRAQWQENLGVEITWQPMEHGAWVERVLREPPSICFGRWYADYPDPDDFLRVSTALWLPGWRNETYAGLVEEARWSMDQTERMDLYKRADKILVEEAVIMPLNYMRSHLLIKPWVKKHPTTVRSLWSWKDVIIEPH